MKSSETNGVTPRKSLSKREKELLALAAAGYLDKHASVQMGVSFHTVQTYWKRIRSKLGCHPKGALIAAHLEQVSGLTRQVDTKDPLFDWEIDFERSSFRRLSDRPFPIALSINEDVPLAEILDYFQPEDREGLVRLLEEVQRSQIDHFFYVARTILEEPFAYGHAFVLVLRDPNGRALKALGRRVPLYDLRAAK